MMTQNCALLKEWATHEIGFHASGSVDWEGLCHGGLFRYWSHLISRVKSKKRVARLRSDYRHQVPARGTLSELQRDLKEEEERSLGEERKERAAELRGLIARKREKLESLQESQAWQVSKVQGLIDLLGEVKGNYEDLSRRQVSVHKKFIKEIQAETESVHGFRLRLHTLQKGILRVSSSDKQFATVGRAIESHGQRAINQGLSTLRNRVSRPGGVSSSARETFPHISSGNEDQEEEYVSLLEFFQELGSGQIRREFTQAFLLAGKDLKGVLGRIDLRKDALRIQSELDKKNGVSRIGGKPGPKGVQGLVQELTQHHVTSGREAKKNMAAITSLELKNTGLLASIGKDLNLNHSKVESQLMHRNIELQMNYIKLSGILKKLHESIDDCNEFIQKNSDNGISKDNYVRIGKQADEIREIQQEISNLISHNRSFPSRLDGLVSEIKGYRSGELRDIVSSDLLQLLRSVENQFTERYEHFRTLPIGVFSSAKGTLRPSMDQLNALKLSIHRLSHRKLHPCSAEVEEIMKESIHLPSTIAPGKTLLTHAMDLKREVDYLKSWLDVNSSNKFQAQYNSIQELYNKLRAIERKTEVEDIPKAQENLAVLEDLEVSLERLSSEVDIWKKDPAQYTILEDPAFTYKEEPLKKWLEKYRIAFLEMKKQAASQ